MNFLNAMFSFSGYMSRLEYWKAIIFYIWTPAIVMLLLGILVGIYNFSANEIVLPAFQSAGFLEWIVIVLAFYEVYACSIGMLAIMAKRLNDFSITPWMSLLYLIPPLTLFIVILYGMFPTNVNSYER